jgi:hypothetical protein
MSAMKNDPGARRRQIGLEIIVGFVRCARRLSESNLDRAVGQLNLRRIGDLVKRLVTIVGCHDDVSAGRKIVQKRLDVAHAVAVLPQLAWLTATAPANPLGFEIRLTSPGQHHEPIVDGNVENSAAGTKHRLR